MAKKNLAVFFTAATLLVAGCDQLAELVGLRKHQLAERRPRSERTPAPTRSWVLAPTVYFPHAVYSPTTEPSTLASASASAVASTPTPRPSGKPWIEARLFDAGNGVKKLEVVEYGGGFVYSRVNRKPHHVDWWAIHSVDGEMYLRVGDWVTYIPGSAIGWEFDEIRGVGWTFRISRLTDEAVELELAASESSSLSVNGMDEQALAAAYGSERQREWIVAAAMRDLPATPSWDVVAIPATSSQTATLSAQAEARWGSRALPMTGLPFFPAEWYNTDDYIRRSRGDGNSWTADFKVGHAVGPGTAFAFRYYPYNLECVRDRPCEWIAREWISGGPLWLRKVDEQSWQQLTSITAGNRNRWGFDDQRYSQIWWSDLHQKWFMWIGAATGSIYIFDNTTAAALP